ncbi:MAG: hypothetical protein FWG64_07270 [Firmicutes bacterium]|nr:hypothetical protein [Bacillota bacterium]
MALPIAAIYTGLQALVKLAPTMLKEVVPKIMTTFEKFAANQDFDTLRKMLDEIVIEEFPEYGKNFLETIEDMAENWEDIKWEIFDDDKTIFEVLLEKAKEVLETWDNLSEEDKEWIKSLIDKVTEMIGDNEEMLETGDIGIIDETGELGENEETDETGESNETNETSNEVDETETDSVHKAEVENNLKEEYPETEGYQTQQNAYLLNENGNIVRDPVTYEAKQIDYVVADSEGNIVDSVMAKSQAADNTTEFAKESRIREAGGNYIKLADDKLVEIPNDLLTRLV